jgi:hypothetical protein
VRRAIALLALLCATSAAADPLTATEEARARQLAYLLGIEPQIDLLVEAPPPTNTAEAIARLNAVELAIVDLSRAALTVDSTVARLQHEEVQAKNAYDFLETRHEDSVTRWNIGAILMGNGVAVVGTAMQFGNDTVAKAGDWVVIGGSALAAAFSIVALIKHDVGAPPLPIETNLLAAFFDRPATGRSRYADWIWRYLDTPLPGAKGSIRAELIEKWTNEKRVPPSKDHRYEKKIDALTRPLTKAKRVDADVIDDRADMLADVRERLGSLSVDIELLWRQVHTVR